MAVPTSINLTISSEIRLVDLVHEVTQRTAELAGFDEDEALNVGLAIREALINAIHHGNSEDPSKPVEIELRIDPSRGMLLTVRDHGNGFDPEASPDPTDAEHLLDTSGRGLLMMRAFVDEVEFDRAEGDGMEVRMLKKFGGSQA